MMAEGAVEVPKSLVEATMLNLGMVCSELVEVATAVAPMLSFPGTELSLREEECMRMFRKA
jgi:hypothetical protein